MRSPKLKTSNTGIPTSLVPARALWSELSGERKIRTCKEASMPHKSSAWQSWAKNKTNSSATTTRSPTRNKWRSGTMQKPKSPTVSKTLSIKPRNWWYLLTVPLTQLNKQQSSTSFNRSTRRTKDSSSQTDPILPSSSMRYKTAKSVLVPPSASNAASTTTPQQAVQCCRQANRPSASQSPNPQDLNLADTLNHNLPHPL